VIGAAAALVFALAGRGCAPTMRCSTSARTGLPGSAAGRRFAVRQPAGRHGPGRVRVRVHRRRRWLFAPIACCPAGRCCRSRSCRRRPCSPAWCGSDLVASASDPAAAGGLCLGCPGCLLCASRSGRRHLRQGHLLLRAGASDWAASGAWGRGALMAWRRGSSQPAFFVVYLLVTRQFRAAAARSGVPVTVLVGAVLLPATRGCSGRRVRRPRPGRGGRHPATVAARLLARLLGMGWRPANCSGSLGPRWGRRGALAGRPVHASGGSSPRRCSGHDQRWPSPVQLVHHWSGRAAADRAAGPALPGAAAPRGPAWLAAGSPLCRCHWFFAWFAGFAPLGVRRRGAARRYRTPTSG